MSLLGQWLAGWPVGSLSPFKLPRFERGSLEQIKLTLGPSFNRIGLNIDIGRQ